MYNYKSKMALNNLSWCCIGTKFGSSRSPLNAVEASFSTDDLAKSEGEYENENLQSYNSEEDKISTKSKLKIKVSK